MTAAELLRDLVEALPKTEFWTPKLHAAEKAARAYMDEQVARQFSDSEAIASTPFDSTFGFHRKPRKAKGKLKVKR